MSLESHIKRLKSDHQNLSDIIEKEGQRPGVCPTYMKGLKLRKMQLKEEITHLAGGFAQPEAEIIDFPQADEDSPPDDLEEELAAVGT